MKSRAIALGASVIALTLAGGSTAAATGLGEVSQPVKVEGDTAVSGPVGSVDAQAKVKVPVEAPSKAHAGDGGRPTTAVQTKGHSPAGRSEADLKVDGRAPEALVYVEHRAPGKLAVETGSRARRDGAQSWATARAGNKGHAYAAGGVDRLRGKRAVQAKRATYDRSSTARPAAPGNMAKKPLAALRAVGHEVGNPLQLSLAAWLIVLFGGSCLAVSRLARRARRLS
jgi:hypothetical protein